MRYFTILLVAALLAACADDAPTPTATNAAPATPEQDEYVSPTDDTEGDYTAIDDPYEAQEETASARTDKKPRARSTRYRQDDTGMTRAQRDSIRRIKERIDQQDNYGKLSTYAKKVAPVSERVEPVNKVAGASATPSRKASAPKASTTNSGTATGGVDVQFDELTYDFGTVKEGTMVSHKFFYSNVGSKPFVIKEASGTCGCTQPGYSKSPLAPGEASYVNVTFNTKGKTGEQNPVITLVTNAKPSTYKIKLSGTVTPAEEEDGQ